jgi:2,3-dimethylmalate lyase
MGTAQKLRKLMGEGMVVAPFCLNAYHAKIAQMVGFEAVYMTGWGTAAERGFPDVGLITQTEMVENARYIANAVDLPVIADADTGYGNSINVWRTVREHESAGVAAVHIEDQVFPKKCGFFEGKQVIPSGENVQKIKAALDARQDKDFVIIARCDALAVNGWEDTIKRCNAYHEAGADLIFVDGIRTTDDLKRYAKDFKEIPKLYNGGLLPTHEVADMGFKMMITARTNLLIFKAVKEAFETLKKEGTVMEEFKTTNSDLFKEAADMLGLSAIYEMEKRYKD